MARYAHEDWNGEQLAIGLGWFSIALGLAEVAAPGRVALTWVCTPYRWRTDRRH